MKTSPRTVEESELLVLSDGKILAHNITPEMAALLCELDPRNNLMKRRMAESLHRKHETAKRN